MKKKRIENDIPEGKSNKIFTLECFRGILSTAIPRFISFQKREVKKKEKKFIRTEGLNLRNFSYRNLRYKHQTNQALVFRIRSGMLNSA